MKMAKTAIIPVESIAGRILVLRGHRVMLDSDLSELYGVETKILNRAVKRNAERFPEGFMFQLTMDEFDDLRRQFGTSSRWGGRRYPPYAFTEHGAVMLASVLSSPTAIQASIRVVEAFVRMRELLSTHKELAAKLAELEKKVGDHDGAISAIVEAIRALMEAPEAPRSRKVGFHAETPDDGEKKSQGRAKKK